ncbi:MAG: hypothetical protein EOO88_20755 [Pedobacter sp.]|nr:MAG: hypothetical protein EOO88_20755 [Pedobacter sp.]
MVYMRRNLVCILSLMLLAVSLQGCRKEWLEAKWDKSLLVPETIADFQALLDNTSQVFNINQSCGLAEISAGDFYITNTSYQSLFNVQEKSSYIWQETAQFYRGELNIDWGNAYKRILNANVILDGINRIDPVADERESWNNVKGAALFFRAFDFFSLSQEFCESYAKATAEDTPGLPLRLDYDVNVKAGRSSLQQTYDQITGDLKLAAKLLGTTALHKTRPSRQAAFALLARTYLAMEQYPEAALYADSALQIQSGLLQYANLKSTAAYPFARFNLEVIFQNTFTYGIFSAARLLVDPSLYASYSVEDCRRTLFFTPNANGVTFKGSYNGDKNLFGGLATDELFLIRAEGRARAGDQYGALQDLNHLLKSRWKGNYTEILPDDLLSVLTLILRERRKQLLFRGVRWSDLRRLNKDRRFAVTLAREVNGTTYFLPPNDGRYVFPIDEDELSKSGIQQNNRGED